MHPANTDKETAVQAALAAGRQLRALRAEWNTVTAEFPHDIKLQADRESETLILQILQKNSPYPVLTEEAGAIGSTANSGWRWIVDPLDGTVNYARGIPLSAVSIGLWHAMTPVYGVIYDFWRDELFHGGPVDGVFLNQTPIKAGNQTTPAQAVLATGFPNARDFDDQALMPFLRAIQSFKKIRLLGSAALSLAYVACGRADAYLEDGIMFWDIAAGIALIQGAGGTAAFTPVPGKPNVFSAAAAATPQLMSAMVAAGAMPK